MHELTKKLLEGVEELKTNPNTQVVAGVYRPVYEIFISKIVGQTDLSRTQELDRLKGQLEQLSSHSGTLEDLGKIFRVSQNQCDFGLHELRLDKNQGATESALTQKAADLTAKSVAYASLTLDLPETQNSNPAVVQRLSGKIYSQENIINNPNLKTNLENDLTSVIKEAKAPPLDRKTISDLALRTSSIIQPQKGTPNTALLAGASLLITLLSQTGNEEIDETPSEDKEEAKAPPNAALGIGLGGIYTLGRLSKKTPEDSKKDTGPPPSPTIPPSNKPLMFQGLTSLVGRLLRGGVGQLFKKAFDLGITAISAGTSKILTSLVTVGKRFLSFLGGAFNRSRQGGNEPNYFGLPKTASIILSVVVFIPFVLIVGFSLFQNPFLNTTTFVDQNKIATNSANSTNQPQNVFKNANSDAPQDFPLSSSCVIELPNSTSNIIGIAPTADPQTWFVKSTHLGKVLFAGYLQENYGETVIIESDNQKFITYYGHLAPGSITVKVDDQVLPDTKLGTVDNNKGFLLYELRGTKTDDFPLGEQSGVFGAVGTILNYVPGCSLWSSDSNCLSCP